MAATGHHGLVTPCLRYRDARSAIAWLVRVLGFTEQLVVPGEGDDIAHAQLVLGIGMVMLGSDRQDMYGFRAPRPDGAGAALNCFVIDDLDDLFARVVGAGERALEGCVLDTPYGSRAFTVRDPEGHLWHFGTYDPWASPSP
ncbi:glyoxalase [Niveispirillum lacus]|uniref:Glyoxalase n=1 Tax=Niveispirillum lacus TaxID=1981099 RepID=A0A255Z1C9_9PROT|nr:VOC family protein [Niveispirillum lacus]OYQ35276.1 glyoxalase [Niveispirillum lacus]